MRTAIVFSAIIIAKAINSVVVNEFLKQNIPVLAIIIFMFVVMDVLDFGKSRN